ALQLIQETSAKREILWRDSLRSGTHPRSTPSFARLPEDGWEWDNERHNQSLLPPEIGGVHRVPARGPHKCDRRVARNRPRPAWQCRRCLQKLYCRGRRAGAAAGLLVRDGATSRIVLRPEYHPSGNSTLSGCGGIFATGHGLAEPEFSPLNRCRSSPPHRPRQKRQDFFPDKNRSSRRRPWCPLFDLCILRRELEQHLR